MLVALDRLGLVRRRAQGAPLAPPLPTESGGSPTGDPAESDRSPEQLLRDAHTAMDETKALNADRCLAHLLHQGRSRTPQVQLVDALRAAVQAGDLRLAYQPVVRLDTGSIVGVEALARWTSGGVCVPPDVFIGAAEQSGLVIALGELVLDLVAEDAEQLRAAAGSFLDIGVNISALQLQHPSFVDKVEATLAAMQGVGLVLEITERDLVGQDSVSVDTMSRLCAKGVGFAIDDFGVGSSTIDYLHTMPVRILKVDRSFLADIDSDERSCALLGSIMTMGSALGLDVVVEGLERESQVEHLREHVGANLAQGYLLHHPMPLDDVVDVLRGDRPCPVPQPAHEGTA